MRETETQVADMRTIREVRNTRAERSQDQTGRKLNPEMDHRRKL